MTGGDQERDFIYVDDVVRGYLRAASQGCDGQSYDLGWGEAHPIGDVVVRLYRILGAQHAPERGSLPYRPGEVSRLVAHPRAAMRDLSWSPTIRLEEGLALTVTGEPGSPVDSPEAGEG
jgi:UDP-glucose 4-epimerase